MQRPALPGAVPGGPQLLAPSEDLPARLRERFGDARIERYYARLEGEGAVFEKL